MTRSITGHATAAMTEHYSHVDAREKLAAASRSSSYWLRSAKWGIKVGDRTDPAHLTRTRENYNSANLLSAVEKT